MTHRERDALRFIERYVSENDGVAPTLAEIAEALGLASKSGAHRILTCLQRDGLIERGSGYSRTVRVAHASVDLADVTDTALLTEAARRGLVKVAA